MTARELLIIINYFVRNHGRVHQQLKSTEKLININKEPGAQQKYWFHVKYAVNVLNRKTAICDLQEATSISPEHSSTGHGNHFTTPVFKVFSFTDLG